MIIKEVAFDGFGGAGGVVTYQVIPEYKECIFSQAVRPGISASRIDDIVPIVSAISAAEAEGGLNLQDFIFFDLARKKVDPDLPEVAELRQMVFTYDGGDRPRLAQWFSHECAPEVLERFGILLN